MKFDTVENYHKWCDFLKDMERKKADALFQEWLDTGEYPEVFIEFAEIK